MNARIRLMGVGVLALLCWAGSAGATTIFSDSFEGYAAVTDWTSPPDADPGTPPVVGPAWVTNESNVTHVQVLNAAAGTNYDCPGPVSGSKYLSVWKEAGDSEAWALVSVAGQTELAAGKKLLIDTMIDRSDLYGYNGTLTIAGFNSDPDVFTGSSFSLDLRTDGHLWYYDGTSYTNTSVLYAEDTWQRFRVEADFSAQTYKAAIGDNWTAALPFVENVSNVQSVIFYCNPLTRAWVDDFSMSTIAVPEPSAIVLVTMGLLGLLAYAWRKRR